MKRVLTVLFAIGLIIFLLAGGVLSAYAVGALAENYLFVGASRLTNIIFLMLVFVMIIATLLTLAERKWSALMQDRIGPNRARINLPVLRNMDLAGLPFVLADSVKMLTKEAFVPEKANRFLFNLGPLLAFAPAFALFAIVPAGPSVQLWDAKVDMVVATPDFGLLYLFAIASLAVYGTALAGWASNNKFALLGGVRASSQMISYEVALGLSLVGIMLAFASVQLPTIVGNLASEPVAQAGVQAGQSSGQARYLWQWSGVGGGFDLGLPAWGILLQPLGFILFFAAAFAETKRAPFDVPEGESEIIGYFVEYSGMQFGLFMISEFVEVVVLSGVVAALFFGGYHLPFGGEWLATQLRDYPLVYATALGTFFWIKVLLLCYLQLLIRWTFPRFRYDQIQTLGWKMLLPAGLVNVFVSGALVLWDPSLRYLALFGLLQIGVLIALTLSSKGGAVESHGHGGGHGHGHGALGSGHDDHGHGLPAGAHGHAALPAHGHATSNLGGHAPAGAHAGAHSTSTH
ncbi:complex I subunit 1/NuoH family protein [Hyalangium rubrum]|uniref:NADH-quinone oxidoreductase subunit H n=1 Tax=Hyalangium rubrum TaxID=3103134 RepID=A0ABU5GZ66_9BACT|nr:complex I subunit 1 family protein [Hyalangium sp. s54d21]MDY7225130.1 complex I subunit 1 family protein [Hyalangium sp. s54d21]